MFVDTHAHLDLCTPAPDVLVDAALDANVGHIVQVATCVASSRLALELANKFPQVSPTAGIHPLSVSDFSQVEELARLANTHRSKLVALGEMGLDYKYEHDPAQQKRVFLKQLELAQSLGLPAIIHHRYAEEDMAQILNQFTQLPVVLHCFSSDQAFLDQVYRENLFISLTGMITYSKKGKVVRAVRDFPLSQIMIETDCPYLSPKAFKGQENQPAFVLEVAKRIAEIKGCSLDTVREASTQNAGRFFGLTDFGLPPSD